MSSSTLPFRSDRRFRVWEFWVSHSMLLIRSAHSEVSPHNVDLVFNGVSFLSIPWLFEGLTVNQGDDAAHSDFQRMFPGRVHFEIPGHALFVLESGPGTASYIAAASLLVDHNDRPPMTRRLNPLE